MSEQIPLKSSEEIKFGKAATAATGELAYGYYVLGYDSVQAIDNESSTHPWVVLLKAFRQVFAAVRDESFVLNGATFINAVGMFNLGRLARIHAQGDSYLYSLSNLENEIARRIDGVVCTTTTGFADYVEVAKWIYGAQMDGFIGSWNSTKYKPADDVLAGCLIVLCYVMFWWTGFLKSHAKLIKKLGTFSTMDGVLRGNFQPLVNSMPSTWGSLLVSNENEDCTQYGNVANTHTEAYGAGVDLFGLTALMVDDALLRGITVNIYTQANAFWDKLLTRTEWQWRFGKSVSYEPIFIPFSMASGYIGCNGLTTAVDPGFPFSDCALFSAATIGPLGNNWRWFNWYVNDTVSSFKDFFFRNAAFGKIKSLFVSMPFMSVPTPPEIGLGGLLVHQFAHYADGGAGADVACFKGLLDTNHCGHRVLAARRGTDANNRFLTLGDITIEDYRLFNALTAMNYYSLDAGASSTRIATSDAAILRLITGFCFFLTKTEDLPYQIDRKIRWFYADAADDHNLEYVSGTSTARPGKTIIPPRTWTLNAGSLTEEFPVSLSHPKTIYYYGRSSDPFKKLAHHTHDVNHLDADLCRKSVLSVLFPMGSNTVVNSPIPVSAMSKMDGEIVEGVTDPVSTQPPSGSVIQPVSSIASAAKDVSQAKKDVTVAEKALSVEKKKADK